MTPEQNSYLAGWAYAARTVDRCRWYEVVDHLSRAMAWIEDSPTASVTAYSAGKIDGLRVALETIP